MLIYEGEYLQWGRKGFMAKRKNGASGGGEQYTLSEIMKDFGLSRASVERCFPAPKVRRYVDENGKWHRIRIWTARQVEEGLSHPKIAQVVRKEEAAARRRREEEENIRRLLLRFDIEKLRVQAAGLSRRFVLHVGPTNSGKTYHAVKRLKEAKTGVYLGPLRLLALEMYDRMNQDGVPCSLLTGEESVPEEGARHVASTIELADLQAHYEVAVIDEAQMVTDPFRGDKWLRALYCLDAEEIHVCMAPEARELICSLLDSFRAGYTVVEHERLAPLYFKGTFSDTKDTKPGDALIVFSRKSVLALSAELEQHGIPASVIYGALPPVSRREEVRKFTEGETLTVVATDAIGMGISLPIHRIIFCETSKFDGVARRRLNSREIKQIAGRAGRYGIYPEGEVLTVSDERMISQALTCREEPQKKLMIPFPAEALESPYPIDRLLIEWNRLPRNPSFERVNMSDAVLLYSHIRPYAAKADRDLLFRLITCPLDVKSDDLIRYWLRCSRCILSGRRLPEPDFGTEDLESCELRYKELDIRHQLLRQIGVEEDRMDEKMELCTLINRYLQEHRNDYLRRCSRCGRVLPSVYPYGICEACYELEKRQMWHPGGTGKNRY